MILLSCSELPDIGKTYLALSITLQWHSITTGDQATTNQLGRFGQETTMMMIYDEDDPFTNSRRFICHINLLSSYSRMRQLAHEAAKL
jgi:hypothetical protein